MYIHRYLYLIIGKHMYVYIYTYVCIYICTYSYVYIYTQNLSKSIESTSLLRGYDRSLYALSFSRTISSFTQVLDLIISSLISISCPIIAAQLLRPPDDDDDVYLIKLQHVGYKIYLHTNTKPARKA
jgi:hypothetical protein